MLPDLHIVILVSTHSNDSLSRDGFASLSYIVRTCVEQILSHRLGGGWHDAWRMKLQWKGGWKDKQKDDREDPHWVRTFVYLEKDRLSFGKFMTVSSSLCWVHSFELDMHKRRLKVLITIQMRCSSERRLKWLRLSIAHFVYINSTHTFFWSHSKSQQLSLFRIGVSRGLGRGCCCSAVVDDTQYALITLSTFKSALAAFFAYLVTLA